MLLQSRKDLDVDTLALYTIEVRQAHADSYPLRKKRLCCTSTLAASHNSPQPIAQMRAEILKHRLFNSPHPATGAKIEFDSAKTDLDLANYYMNACT